MHHNPRRDHVPWGAVFFVTALAAVDAATPGVPFPGTAFLTVPLAAATILKKLREYGVDPNEGVDAVVRARFRRGVRRKR